MSPLSLWRGASWAVRILAFCLALALIGWTVTAMFGGKSAKVEAELGKNQTEAAMQSGVDAVTTTGAVEAKTQDRAKTAETTKQEIGNAKDARSGDAAARRGLCRQSIDLCAD